jgi:hypothetical protein
MIRSGGVAVFENMNISSPNGLLQSIEHDLFELNRENMNVKRIAISHEDIGDICSIETTRDDQPAAHLGKYAAREIYQTFTKKNVFLSQ